jgi:hypothetical protein
MDRLPARVQSALAAAGEAAAVPSPALASAIADGARIAAVLARMPSGAGKQRWPADVIQRVMAHLGL